LDRRGVSEVLSAILIAVIVMGMSISYTLFEMERSERQTMSLIDLIRGAEIRQKQLLSLIYYYEEGGVLKVYIYNFGDVPSTPKRIFTDREVPLSEVTIKDPSSGELYDTILPKTLVEIALPAPAEAGIFTLVILTEKGGIFSWEMSV